MNDIIYLVWVFLFEVITVELIFCTVDTIYSDGLLQQCTFSNASLILELIAHKKFFAHAPPEIRLLFAIKAEKDLWLTCDVMQPLEPPAQSYILILKVC